MSRLPRVLLVGVLAGLGALCVCGVAQADTHYDGEGASDAFEIVGTEATEGSQGTQDSADTDSGVAYVAYQWASACGEVGGGAPDTVVLDCGAARTCSNPLERRWRLWGQRPDGDWEPLQTQCFGAPPTAAQTPRPQITPGLVLSELRRIGLPKLEVHIQPEGKTLVNFATNFYVTPQPFTRTITLLGGSVEVEATPTQYTWLHGDGTTASTTSPGAPYPDLTVTYAYQQPATVTPSVRVTYQARFRVEGGGWQQIPETVTVDGPPADLQVVEGTAVLSGDH